MRFFDTYSSGRLVTRVTNDVEALNEMYSGVVVHLFKDVFMLIGIIVMMLNLNAKLAVISFTVVPFIVIVFFFYKKKAREIFKKIKSTIGRINGFLAENISGMRLVQVFNREKEKFGEFAKLNDEYNRYTITEIILHSLLRPGMEVIAVLGTSIILWYSAGRVLDNTLEIGVLYAFITYIKQFFGPINDLSDKYYAIQSASVSAGRIFEILDNKAGIEDLDCGRQLEKVRGKIEFKNVWFSYDNVEWVLKDVSFKVKPGETVAFVGATGSGKSTIINLLARFYDIQKGEILLDGINIKEYKLADLRRHISVVLQDVFLFSGNIKENIRLYDPGISNEDVARASRYVGADSFISELPDGYEEEVKERGCTLSLGERQLLSFARAVAHNPSVLVLDEATSNIDTATELLIQKSLEEISRNRTTLVIAHRLSTIRNADKIIVIHKGRISGIGTHEELIDKNEIYSELYNSYVNRKERQTGSISLPYSPETDKGLAPA